jgi:hypothetical protein
MSVDKPDQVTGASDFPRPFLPSTENDDAPANSLSAYEQDVIARATVARDDLRKASAATQGTSAIDRIRAGQQRPNMHGFKLGSGGVLSDDEAPYHPPIMLDPGYVTALAAKHPGFEQYFKSTQEAFETAFTGLQAIDKARTAASANPAFNPFQVLLEVGGFAEKHYERMTKTFDAVTKNLTDGINGLENQLRAPLNSSASPNSKEMRDYAKGLTEKARSEYLATAVRDNNIEVLTALLGAPHYLSGLHKSAHDYHTYQYRRAQAPQLFAQQTAMKAARDLIEARSGLVHAEVPKAMRGDFTKLKKVREASTAAAKALAFEQAV